MTGDGLPIAYTQEELYDTVVTLRSQIKKDKELLSELDILFSFVSKLLDSVAETAFLGITSSGVTRNIKSGFVFQLGRTLLHYRLRHGWLPPRLRFILWQYCVTVRLSSQGEAGAGEGRGVREVPPAG